MVHALACGLEISVVELQLPYKSWERYETPYPYNYGLVGTTTFLQGGFWYQITHESWYAIR